jgi:nucleoside-diphosphate kinase
MLERTFCMLKPGVLQRRLVGEVLQRLEQKGLTIVAMKMAKLDRAVVEAHYGEHRGKDFFPALVDYTVSAPVILLALEGYEAVKVLRILIGATDVLSALPGTIRGDFCGFTRKNIVHASDSSVSAQREPTLFFYEDEIFVWEDGNSSWVV